MHNILTGKACTRIIHFLNKIPIYWYSKKQARFKTATYSAEKCACCTCIEQIVDLQNTLQYLGVNLNSKICVFGDNESMIKSSQSCMLVYTNVTTPYHITMSEVWSHQVSWICSIYLQNLMQLIYVLRIEVINPHGNKSFSQFLTDQKMWAI